MKKIFLILALCLIGMSARAQEQLPKWAQDLIALNTGVIDSICPIPVDPGDLKEAEMTSSDLISHSYMIYYHQPRKHSEPQGEQFSLRATITVYDDVDPTKVMNQIFFGGYSLMKWWIKSPDIYWAQDAATCSEIARRYHGNYICPEYRYFQYSSPVKCYEKLEDLSSQEAAEDFHNLLEALKKVFMANGLLPAPAKEAMRHCCSMLFIRKMQIYLCHTLRPSLIPPATRLCSTIGSPTDGIRSTAICL